MEFLKLTVYSYGDIAEEDRRVTLNPANITVVAAATEDTVVNGRHLRLTTVLFSDGGSVDLKINNQDLETLESAVGSYCLG